MSQSLSSLLVHLVFSTKNRSPILQDAWRNALHSYIGGTLRDFDSQLIAANSVTDHIHLLFPLPRTVPIADVVREIKANSSRWINDTQALHNPFRWQSGYGVFSVSACQQARIVQYIENQQEHHRTQTYQEEFRRLLEEYAIAYDERYVWD